MPNQLVALALILLAALPSFSGKADLEQKITKELLGVNSKIESIQNISNDLIIPEKKISPEKISANATAAYFIDLDSGEVLFAKNENKKLPIASTTKLMTAILVQEKLDPNQVVTVATINNLPLDSIMGLAIGDRLRVSELANGMLIESGGDAALTLAIAASGTEKKFVAEMNEKASRFGLSETEFENPIGHDSDNNFSTAKDLSKLARIALSNKEIASIVNKKTYTATSEDGKNYYLSNTNLLLSDPNFKGVKTGTTFAAGECLISIYDDGERKILGVVLDSSDRYYDTKNIVEWTKQAFKW